MQRQHRLTDALVDGLVSKAVFNERKKGLILEEQALIADEQASAGLAQKAAQVGSLIELTKTLVKATDWQILSKSAGSWNPRHRTDWSSEKRYI